MIKSIKVVTYLTMKYPGGMQKFMNDGGAVCYLPEPTDLMYIIHPDLADEIKSGLVGMFGNSIIFGERWNFDGASEEEYRTFQDSLDSILSDLELGRVASTVNPAVVCVTLPDLKKDDARIEKLVQCLTAMPGLLRGIFICKNGVVPFQQEEIEDEKPSKKPAMKETATPSMFEGRPNRDKVITDDDVLNIRIALESSKTLEELLQQL